MISSYSTARAPVVAARATRRSARGARRALPWAAPRRRRRGSGGAGSGTRPRRRTSSGRAGSAPCATSVIQMPLDARGTRRRRRAARDGARARTPCRSTEARSITARSYPAEPVEPRRHECVDRRRDRSATARRDFQRSVLRASGRRRPASASSLLDEQRVALGGRRGCARGPRATSVGPAEQVVDQLAPSRRRRAARARPSAALSLPADPVGRRLEELGPRPGRASRIGASRRPVGQVLDQVEERRLRPLDVVEDDDEWPAPSRASRAAVAPPRTSPPARPTPASTSPSERRDPLGDRRRPPPATSTSASSAARVCSARSPSLEPGGAR